MFKRFLIALIAVVAIVVVCGGLIGFNMFRAKMIAGFFANQQMPSVTVSATEVRPITWNPQIEAIGTLWAFQGVDVASQTAGVVKTIGFKANEEVKQNQLLVQIDDAVERADLVSAEASLARDKAQLERARTLSTRGVSSDAALEEAEATLAVSESTLARIKATLDLKAIEAPFGGSIGIPRVDVGEYVQPGTVIATLQELDTMKVDFTVPEQRVADMKMGQSARFGVAEDDFPYQGRIIGIDPKIDPQTRLVSVRAEVENPDGELRPGQFVRVRVELPAMANIIALPQTAVVTSLYGDYVYLVAEKEAAAGKCRRADRRCSRRTKQLQPPSRRRARAAGPAEKQLVARQTFVTIGRRQGNLIQIVDGLKGGRDRGHFGPEQARQQFAGHHQQRDRPGGDCARRRKRPVVNFSETFIRRPVLTIVTSILILLLGIQGFLSMTVREYPEVEESVITITTVYPGASAELMQGFITTPIAKAVLNADNVDYVTSKSSLGSSTVSVNMVLDADPDQALVDVLAKVQQVRGELPTDAEDPVVQKGTGQDFALMYLAARSTTMNPQQLTEYLTQVIQPRFATVEGVGDVQILGGRELRHARLARPDPARRPRGHRRPTC